MKKLQPTTAPATAVTNLMGGEKKSESLTFEQYSNKDRVMGFKDKSITPTSNQKNILTASNNGTITIGYIPVKELSYLSLNFDIDTICESASKKFKMVDRVELIKDGKSKDSPQVMVAYLNKDDVIKLTDDRDDILGRCNVSMETLINKEDINKHLKEAINKERGICYDTNGDLFVYLKHEAVVSEVLLPEILTIDNPATLITDIPKIIADTAHKHIEISDIKVKDDRLYVAFTFNKSLDTDLVVKVSTDNFVAANISTTLEEFKRKLIEKISFYTTGAEGTGSDLDVTYVDIRDIVASLDKTSVAYKQMVNLTGLDTGSFKKIPLIRYSGKFVRKQDDRDDILGQCNSQSEMYDETKLLTDPFWKYLTTDIILTYNANGRIYFLPDFRKVAIFRYFGGGEQVSPLANGTTFKVGVTTSDVAVGFAISI